MIRRLSQVRLSRVQLGLLATVSLIATVIVIAEASPGRTALQSAVIAELEHRGVVVHRLASASDPGTTEAASEAPGSPALSPGAPSAPASSGSAGAGSGGSSADGGGDSATSTTSTDTSTTGTPTATKTYKVKHVFVIALSTTSYGAAFGHGSVARYLNGTLVRQGTLLSGYRSLGASALSDYLAMLSGQPPNADTSGGCATYAEFPSGAKPNAAASSPVSGDIYPDTVLTIGDQVTGAGHVWKAYIDDMGSSTCVHPDSGVADNTALPGAGADYDTRHNPFIYFHSLLDLGDCSSDDEALTQLPGDLSSVSKTPSYAFIAPGLCEDSSQTSCPGGKPGGLAAEDAFLKQWVPAILRSPAYKHDGALIITFTISKSGASSSKVTTAATGTRAGALVLSQYTTAGRKVSTGYDPYSMLRSVEDLFGYTPLAHATQAKSFDAEALPDA